MKNHRIPILSFQTWSCRCKKARDSIGNVEEILDIWRRMPTHQWSREQLVDILGFRKNAKEDAGEQKIERQLLAPRGQKREVAFRLNDECCTLETMGHNVALTRYRSGQVIADAAGRIHVSGTWHPLAIEIKVKDGHCWSALVQNIQQVRLMRATGAEVQSRVLCGRRSMGDGAGPQSVFLQERRGFERG